MLSNICLHLPAASALWPRFAAFSTQLLELSVLQVTYLRLLLRPVSEDEVTKDADDVGLARAVHVENLLRALTGCAGGRGGRRRVDDREATYSFSLAPDHGRLSFQKISNGVTVSENWSACVAHLYASQTANSKLF